MQKEEKFIQRIIRVTIAGLLLVIFTSSIVLVLKPVQSASAMVRVSPFPTVGKTKSPTEPPSASTVTATSTAQNYFSLTCGNSSGTCNQVNPHYITFTGNSQWESPFVFGFTAGGAGTIYGRWTSLTINDFRYQHYNSGTVGYITAWYRTPYITNFITNLPTQYISPGFEGVSVGQYNFSFDQNYTGYVNVLFYSNDSINYAKSYASANPGILELSSSPIFPAPTPTLTPTVTSTPTSPATSTPTKTIVPGTPRSYGTGTCWVSGSSWSTYTVDFDIVLQGNSAVPADWVVSILDAKDTWNNVSPSQFLFVRQIGSSNTIRYEEPNDPDDIAAAPRPVTGPITESYIKLNPGKPWDTNNISPSSTAFNVQNVVTHEFGHWLFLDDIDNTSCTHVTMDHDIAKGEILKIDLDVADINAINWQYP